MGKNREPRELAEEQISQLKLLELLQLAYRCQWEIRGTALFPAIDAVIDLCIYCGNQLEGDMVPLQEEFNQGIKFLDWEKPNELGNSKSIRVSELAQSVPKNAKLAKVFRELSGWLVDIKDRLSGQPRKLQTFAQEQEEQLHEIVGEIRRTYVWSLGRPLGDRRPYYWPKPSPFVRKEERDWYPRHLWPIILCFPKRFGKYVTKGDRKKSPLFPHAELESILKQVDDLVRKDQRTPRKGNNPKSQRLNASKEMKEHKTSTVKKTDEFVNSPFLSPTTFFNSTIPDGWLLPSAAEDRKRRR
jgi:hypothetical protein